ncbi:MAG: DUF3822 family protein [Bacteroidia bacterium]|nr:DUF3822 family protein [Bacteroidia bacterium]
MNGISLSDETLNINSTSAYLLSMQAGMEGFSYCILDTSRNKYIALRHIPFTFEDINSDDFCSQVTGIIDSDEYLNCKYKCVKFIMNTLKSILIPAPLFDKENLPAYFKFNHSYHETETLHYNNLKNAEACNVFSLPYSLVDILYMRFANAKLYHQATPFIENNLIKYKSKGNKQKVFVNICPSFFDILVIQSARMQLYNAFPYKTADECTYFIMYIYDQLKLDPETTELVLSGDIAKNSDLHFRIKKFVRNIQFEKLNDSFTYSYIFNDVLSGFFVNLININRCE